MSDQTTARRQFGSTAAATGYAVLYEGSGPLARFFNSRITLISEELAALHAGDLLDVGCGPGMMVRQLIDARPGDFTITALDRSPGMIEQLVERAGPGSGVRANRGHVEALPFSDDSFDVVLGMGVPEYTDPAVALREISRVARPEGLVLVTMLNPTSPYRMFEWYASGPSDGHSGGWSVCCTSRGATARQGSLDAAGASGAHTLRRIMVEAGLRPVDIVHFDVNYLVPPIDRIVRRWTDTGRNAPTARSVVSGTGSSEAPTWCQRAQRPRRNGADTARSTVMADARDHSQLYRHASSRGCMRAILRTAS